MLRCFTWNRHETRNSVAITTRKHDDAIELLERLGPLLGRKLKLKLISEYVHKFGIWEEGELEGTLGDLRVRHTDETHTVYVDL